MLRTALACFFENGQYGAGLCGKFFAFIVCQFIEAFFYIKRVQLLRHTCRAHGDGEKKNNVRLVGKAVHSFCLFLAFVSVILTPEHTSTSFSAFILTEKNPELYVRVALQVLLIGHVILS